MSLFSLLFPKKEIKVITVEDNFIVNACSLSKKVLKAEKSYNQLDFKKQQYISSYIQKNETKYNSSIIKNDLKNYIKSLNIRYKKELLDKFLETYLNNDEIDLNNLIVDFNNFLIFNDSSEYSQADLYAFNKIVVRLEDDIDTLRSDIFILSVIRILRSIFTILKIKSANIFRSIQIWFNFHKFFDLIFTVKRNNDIYFYNNNIIFSRFLTLNTNNNEQKGTCRTFAFLK